MCERPGSPTRGADGRGRGGSCDINRRHVDWCNLHLPRSIRVFQNTSLPLIPLPEGAVDLVSAFSVFSHIEAFDTTWLMEIRRVLAPAASRA